MWCVFVCHDLSFCFCMYLATQFETQCMILNLFDYKISIEIEIKFSLQIIFHHNLSQMLILVLNIFSIFVPPRHIQTQIALFDICQSSWSSFMNINRTVAGTVQCRKLSEESLHKIIKYIGQIKCRHWLVLFWRHRNISSSNLSNKLCKMLKCKW